MPQQYDDNAEIRAMILTALPFPPIPVMCRSTSEEDSWLGDEKSITTHDIISKLMEEASNINDPKIHQAREKQQKLVLSQFMNELVHLSQDHEMQPPELYQLYCKYSIKHIQSYFSPDKEAPINLLHMDTVQMQDSVHSQMRQYMAGQAVLFGLQPDKSEAWKNHPYFAMLLEAKQRLITETPSNSSS